MSRLPVFLFVCALLLCCEGRPDGAPKSACSSLTPVHSGIPVQRTSSPYSVSVVKNGDKVRVKIYSTVGEEFEGFVLQARSSKNKNMIIDGKFTQRDGVSRAIDCFRGKENTLTQVNPSPKREIVTDWTPSGSLSEDVIFRATVAKTFALFWTELDSSPVRMRSDGAGADRSQQQEEPSGIKMYHNCFVSKGCFGLPSGCINRRDCEVLLSYRHSTEGVAFQMNGFLEQLTYMAMGLSTDPQMGDDYVTECYRRDSTVVARESWNDGKSNNRNRELPRDKYDGSYTNGLTSCSWTAKYITEANGRRFNLANSTYYVLLAKGPVNERNERLSYHSGRIATQDPVNFTAFEAIEAEGVSDSIKIHGESEESSFTGVTEAHLHSKARVTEANSFAGESQANSIESVTEEHPSINATSSTESSDPESIPNGGSCFTISAFLVLCIGLVLL